ncbi:hypothetical protein CGRA01v4_10705 [Colletotrichum graminicola]|nr:hypothetical protein CGRA01v4_10705 [Colletotrichum graminicola]
MEQSFFLSHFRSTRADADASLDPATLGTRQRIQTYA